MLLFQGKLLPCLGQPSNLFVTSVVRDVFVWPASQQKCYYSSEGHEESLKYWIISSLSYATPIQGELFSKRFFWLNSTLTNWSLPWKIQQNLVLSPVLTWTRNHTMVKDVKFEFCHWLWPSQYLTLHIYIYYTSAMIAKLWLANTGSHDSL